MTPPRHWELDSLPTYDELPEVDGGARSGWHVFGRDDQVGLLNLQTPDRVLYASRLVQSGEIFSLNLNLSKIDPPLYGRGAYVHSVIDEGTGNTFDDKLDNFYPQLSSQWDSLAHVGYSPDNFYNATTTEQVLRGERNTIEHWAKRGIAGRGVVLDIAALYQEARPRFTPGESIRISVDDLDNARRNAHIEWMPGDVLLLHTGFLHWYTLQDLDVRLDLSSSDDFSSIGLESSPDMLAYLWNNRISAVAADNPAVEVTPFDLGPKNWPFGFLHQCLIGQLGMAIGELWWLHDLAMACRGDARYEVLLTSAPMNLTGAIGSPANALALR